MAGDQELNIDQRVVLQAVYDWFREHAEWPSFIEIDRPLRRLRRDLNTRSIIQSLPDALIVKPQPATWYADNDEVCLRLEGIHACEGGSEDTERFVRLLRWFAQKELDFEPPQGTNENMPQVTADEAGEYLDLERHDYVTAQRLFVMLQLGNWGLGGGGLDPSGKWFVVLSRDVSRFHDVETVEDCVRIQLEWRLEPAAAAPRIRGASQDHYHVRVSTKSTPTWDEVQLDLSVDELEQRFLAPYREGRPIVINGKTVQLPDLEKLRINRTDKVVGTHSSHRQGRAAR